MEKKNKKSISAYGLAWISILTISSIVAIVTIFKLVKLLLY